MDEALDGEGIMVEVDRAVDDTVASVAQDGHKLYGTIIDARSDGRGRLLSGARRHSEIIDRERSSQQAIK